MVLLVIRLGSFLLFLDQLFKENSAHSGLHSPPMQLHSRQECKHRQLQQLERWSLFFEHDDDDAHDQWERDEHRRAVIRLSHVPGLVHPCQQNNNQVGCDLLHRNRNTNTDPVVGCPDLSYRQGGQHEHRYIGVRLWLLQAEGGLTHISD